MEHKVFHFLDQKSYVAGIIFQYQLYNLSTLKKCKYINK